MAAPLSRFGTRKVSTVLRRFVGNRHSNSVSSRHIKCLSYARTTSARCQVLFRPETSSYRQHMTRSERKCWKCNSDTSEIAELFFCNCGVVQKVPTDLSYFDAMECEESFNIDVSKLPDVYKERQRNLHPDKFAQKSKDERLIAENQSAFINKAYTTLIKPLSRGLYLLELKGSPLDEKDSHVDPDFLADIMELNEDLMDAADHPEKMKDFEDKNTSRMQEYVKYVAEAFEADDILRAKENLIKLRYFTNIDDKIRELHRVRM